MAFCPHFFLLVVLKPTTVSLPQDSLKDSLDKLAHSCRPGTEDEEVPWRKPLALESDNKKFGSPTLQLSQSSKCALSSL